MVSRLTGTGCLGLSLRTTTLAAGLITLLESAAWLGFSVATYLTYECSYPEELPKDLSLRLRVAYATYLLNPECRAVSQLTPPGQTEDLSVVGDVVSTARRTFLISIAYMTLSVLWLCASLLLLVSVTKAAQWRRAGLLCVPWLLLTAVTMVMDVAATGLYAVDIANFNTADLEDLERFTDLRLPAAWFTRSTEPGLPPLQTGAIVLTAVAARGVVIWLLNGVLLLHGVRAARRLSRSAPTPARGQPEKDVPVDGQASPRTPTAPGEQRRPEQQPEGVTALLETPAPVVAPVAVANPILPVRSRPVYLPGETSAPVSPSSRRRPPSQRSLTPPPRTPSRAGHVHGHGRPVERHVERPAAAERPVQQSPVGRAPSRFSDHGGRSPTRYSDHGGRSPTRYSDHGGRSPTRYSDRGGRSPTRSPEHEERPAVSREEILHRIERMSVLRSSGRGEAHGVSPAIEAKTREIMMGLAATGSGIPLDYVPPEEPAAARRVRREAHQRHVRNNSADLEPPLARWRRQPEPQPQPRPRRRLDRTQSDRAFATGEWKMAPPGNLHGLSPRHGHAALAAGPGATRILEATEELKREKPWSYLRAAAAAQEEQEDDVFEDAAEFRARHSPGKVVRNMYLPPTTRDAVGHGRRASSGSSSGRQRGQAQQPMEGVFY